jgi:hypothetical protein
VIDLKYKKEGIFNASFFSILTIGFRFGFGFPENGFCHLFHAVVNLYVALRLSLLWTFLT